MTRAAGQRAARGRGAALLLVIAALVAGCSSPAGSSASAPASSVAGGVSLVALGDSIVTGGESGGDASFARLYGDLVARHLGRTVTVTNLADPTETTASLLEKLRSSAEVRTAVAGADIVTVTVGGNDGDPFADHDPTACAPKGDARDCLAAYAPGLETNLDRIVTRIETLRRGARTVVRLTSPDFNPFIGVTTLDGTPTFPRDFGLRFYRQAADAMTDAACRVAKAHDDRCADFLHVFNGVDGDRPATPYLGADHLHPSQQGRRAIADTVLATGLAPLG